MTTEVTSCFENAAAYGFVPEGDASANVAALQRACDGGGKTLVVSRPGVYSLNDTVYLDDHTRLLFGEGVVLEKTGRYSFVLANRGALTRTWNRDIRIDGLHIRVNGVDCIPAEGHPCYGLRGHLTLFCVRNAAITRFRCLDLARGQFTIHVCAFENLLIDGFEIRGMKDGLHIGAGRTFAIRNGLCETFDDAVALNAQDYPSSQPMQGDIEDGLIENVTDVGKKETTGHFGRLLTGAWVDWHRGIRLQHGDTVRHGANVYRVVMKLGTEEFVSNEPPQHTAGVWADSAGLRFVYNQSDGATSASIRNVTFRNIYLRDRRIGFAAYWETGKYHRAVHPATKPEDWPECEVRLADIHGVHATTLISSNSHLRAWLDRVAMDGCLFAGRGDRVRVDLAVTGARFAAAGEGPDIRFAGTGRLNLLLESAMQDRDIRLDIEASTSSRVNGTASVSSVANLSPASGDAIKVGNRLKTYDGTAWC